MEALVLEGNHQFPGVILDPKNEHFEIKGKSVPDDPENYYGQIQSWLDDYAKNPNQTTCFSFRLEYFNITSSKRLLYILYKLNEIFSKGHDVSINWYYYQDEDDMCEVGRDFAFMVNLPFNFIAYKKNQRDTVMS